CDVVSLPSWTHFLARPAEERLALVPPDVLRVSVEAGITLGWERIIGADGLTIGLNQFGASAPAAVLFRHFGFTGEAIADPVRTRLANGHEETEGRNRGARAW
ncbi:transketolase-like TK C-terminal-containing protein, partial [Thermaurantiacus sp.]